MRIAAERWCSDGIYGNDEDPSLYFFMASCSVAPQRARVICCGSLRSPFEAMTAIYDCRRVIGRGMYRNAAGGSSPGSDVFQIGDITEISVGGGLRQQATALELRNGAAGGLCGEPQHGSHVFAAE